MLLDTNTDTPTSIVQPPKTRAVSARLLLRDERGQVIQQWLVRQSKCTFGSAENCDLRCDRPGIAPYHAIIVIGARQAFLRALAPQVARDGVPSNDLMFSPEQNCFEIGELRFELSLQETTADQASAVLPPTPEAAQNRLKFTLARPFALESRPAGTQNKVVERVTQAANASDQDVSNSRTIAKMVRSAIEPLECQLQNVLQPLAQLQAESAAQRALLEEQRHPAPQDNEPRAQLQTTTDLVQREDPSDSQLREALEQFSARQSAAMDVIGERISDLNMQFSAIEQIIASVPNAPVGQEEATPVVDLESSPILQGQSAAIHQLQEGMQSVSSAIQGIEDRQESARENDHQWREQMHSEVEHLRTSLAEISAQDDSDWKNSVQSQVASLRDSIELLAESTAENLSSLAAKTEAGFASRNAQDSAVQWQHDIEQQFQQLRSAVEVASHSSEQTAAPESFDDRPTVAYEDFAAEPADAVEQVPNIAENLDPAASANAFADPSADTVDAIPGAETAALPSDGIRDADLIDPSAEAIQDLHSPDVSPSENDFSDLAPQQGPPTVHDFSPGSLTVGREELENELNQNHSAADNPFAESTDPINTDSAETVNDFEPQPNETAHVADEQDLPESFSQQSAALFAESPSTLAEDATALHSISPDSEFAFDTTEHDAFGDSQDLTAGDSAAADASSTDDNAAFGQAEADLPSFGSNLQSGSLLEQLEREEQSRGESETAANAAELENPGPFDGQENAVDSESLGENASATLESVNQEQEPAEPNAEPAASDLPSWWTEAAGGDSLQLADDQSSPNTESAEAPTTDSQSLTADEFAAPESAEILQETSNESGEFSFGGEPMSADTATPGPLSEIESDPLSSTSTDLNSESPLSAEAPDLPQPGSLAALLAAHENGEEETAEDNEQFDAEPTSAAADALAPEYAGDAEPTIDAESAEGSEALLVQNGLNENAASDLLGLSEPSEFAAESEFEQVAPTPTDDSVPQQEAEQFFGLGAAPAEPQDEPAPKLTLEELEQAERQNDATASLSAPNLESSRPSVGDDDDEEDGSVEDYMKKLLARMRGVPEEDVEVPSAAEVPSSPPAPAPTGRTSSSDPSDVADAANHIQDSEQTPGTEALPAKEEKMSFDSFTPRVTAPERTQSLAAMRELANSSARTAIHRSTRKRHVSGLALKASISIIGLLVGLVLLTINGLTLNIGFVATIAAFLVAGIWGYDAITTLKPLMQAGLVLKPAQNAAAKANAEPQEDAE